jgi:hypothetical protein
MTLRYASTGKPVFDEPVEKKRDYPSPMHQRDEAFDAILQRREAMEKAPETLHDEAVKYFDVQYSDLTKNPALLNEVMSERERMVQEATKKREVIDWHTALPEIGEKIRKKAGLPTSEEREHYEYLQEMRRARGFRK